MLLRTSLFLLVFGGADVPLTLEVQDDLLSGFLGRQTGRVDDHLGVFRHLVRVGDTGEVIDLSSRNGTWLNEGQLMPNKPYPFASGSQLRLARMRLFILYRPITEAKRKM